MCRTWSPSPPSIVRASVNDLNAGIGLKPENEYSQFTVPSSGTSACTSTKLEVLKLSQLIDNWRRCSSLDIWFHGSREISIASPDRSFIWRFCMLGEMLSSSPIAPGIICQIMYRVLFNKNLTYEMHNRKAQPLNKSTSEVCSV